MQDSCIVAYDFTPSTTINQITHFLLPYFDMPAVGTNRKRKGRDEIESTSWTDNLQGDESLLNLKAPSKVNHATTGVQSSTSKSDVINMVQQTINGDRVSILNSVATSSSKRAQTTMINAVPASQVDSSKDSSSTLPESHEWQCVDGVAYEVEPPQPVPEYCEDIGPTHGVCLFPSLWIPVLFRSV